MSPKRLNTRSRSGVNAVDPHRELPHDVYPEILCRLPVKSLLRFRCVSKPWLSLVDEDPNFAQQHLKTFKNNSDKSRVLVVQSIEGKQECQVRCSDTFKLILPPSKTPYRCTMSSNSSIDGLILLRSKHNPRAPFFDLKVWNPSIRKLREIPLLTQPILPSSPVFKGTAEIGLGYDPVTKDYKIVRLIVAKRRPKMLHSVAVYSLRADSWRIVKFQGGGFDWHWDFYSISDAVYFRGSLYFIAWDEFDRPCRSWDLVRFDLSNEVFSVFSPHNDHTDFCVRRLSEIDGELSLEVQNKYSKDVHMWVVDTELMSWNKPRVISLYTLDVVKRAYVKKNGDMLTWRQHHKIVPDERGKERLVSSSDVGLYSCETKKSKILQRVEGVASYKHCFVESLIMHQ